MSKSVAFSCPDAFNERFEHKEGDPWNTHYCPGCGHGLIHKYLATAIDELDVKNRSILVSPVGCAVFAYYYFDVGNIQAPHGRCPAVATAVKRAHPDAVVIGYQGDGDLAAIGANEILQAANRGENVSIFFVNNAIYGMTGGQMAPTTLMGMQTATTPVGRSARNEGFPIKVCELLNSLTAPYYLERVALGDTRHNAKTRKAIRKALEYQVDNKGFSLVEILSPCPTGWKLSPHDAAVRTLKTMTQVFPLGVYRDGHDLDLGHPRRRAEVDPGTIPQLLGLESGDRAIALPDHDRSIDEARFKLSGFGGQGVLAMGLVLAQAGMLARRQVSWMPSYGPEMRGGTAYATVIVSDEEIGSPLVERPTLLVAMNRPSLEKFGPGVVPGGKILYNASLIDSVPRLDGVTLVPVPANAIAEGLGNAKVANMVMIGALVAEDSTVSKEAVLAALPGALKIGADLIELNHKAVDAGIDAVRAVTA